MQNAYATSMNALNQLAAAEIVMGMARSHSEHLPEHGHVAEVNCGSRDSLEVLAAPRACMVSVNGQSFTMTLTPSAGLSIQGAVAEAIRFDAPASLKPVSPQPGPGKKT